MADKEDMIIQSLQRIDKKLDSHDNKFDDIADTLKKLVEVDVMMKEHSDSLKRAFVRIDAIEEKQRHKGCPTLNNYWDVRNEQLKKYDRVVEDFDKRIKNNETVIEDIKSIPNKIMMRMLMTISGALATWFIGYIILEHHLK